MNAITDLSDRVRALADEAEGLKKKRRELIYEIVELFKDHNHSSLNREDQNELNDAMHEFAYAADADFGGFATPNPGIWLWERSTC